MEKEQQKIITRYMGDMDYIMAQGQPGTFTRGSLNTILYGANHDNRLNQFSFWIIQKYHNVQTLRTYDREEKENRPLYNLGA